MRELTIAGHGIINEFDQPTALAQGQSRNQGQQRVQISARGCVLDSEPQGLGRFVDLRFKKDTSNSIEFVRWLHWLFHCTGSKNVVSNTDSKG